MFIHNPELYDNTMFPILPCPCHIMQGQRGRAVLWLQTWVLGRIWALKLVPSLASCISCPTQTDISGFQFLHLENRISAFTSSVVGKIQVVELCKVLSQCGGLQKWPRFPTPPWILPILQGDSDVPPTRRCSLLHPLHLGWPLHWLLGETGGEATCVPFSLGFKERCFHAPFDSHEPTREPAPAAWPARWWEVGGPLLQDDLAHGQPTLGDRAALWSQMREGVRQYRWSHQAPTADPQSCKLNQQ